MKNNDKRFIINVERTGAIREMMGEEEIEENLDEDYNPMLQEEGLTTYYIIRTEDGQFAVPKKLIEMCKKYKYMHTKVKGNNGEDCICFKCKPDMPGNTKTFDN